MKTINRSLLRGLERRVTEIACRHVPPGVGTKALTYLSLASALLTLGGYFLARSQPLFLFAASCFILFQWLFDCLDGAIGRSRGEGFVRWGFYTDHLFDYFFLGAVMAGLAWVIPGSAAQIGLLFFLSAAFMVGRFLSYGALKDGEPELEVSYGGISPIEFRLAILLLNTALFVWGDEAARWVDRCLPGVNLLLAAGLVWMVRDSQAKLSRLDRSSAGRT